MGRGRRTAVQLRWRPGGRGQRAARQRLLQRTEAGVPAAGQRGLVHLELQGTDLHRRAIPSTAQQRRRIASKASRSQRAGAPRSRLLSFPSSGHERLCLPWYGQHEATHARGGAHCTGLTQLQRLRRLHRWRMEASGASSSATRAAIWRMRTSDRHASATDGESSRASAQQQRLFKRPPGQVKWNSLVVSIESKGSSTCQQGC